MSSQVEYVNGSPVSCLSCAADLVAIGDSHALTVLQVDHAGWAQAASFYLGTAVVALAFSPRTISPSADPTNWRIQVAVACADGHIRQCIQLAQSQENVVDIVSNGATTHHGAITSLAYSGASNGRYLASTSVDRTCIVWDLESPQSESDPAVGAPAFPTKFAHRLLSVSSHPKMAEFAVADAAGSVFVLDWAQTGLSPVQLIDPRALADARTGSKCLTGCAAWKLSDSDCIGATFGSRWAVWHLAHGGGGGGKPVLTGNGFVEGGHRFRWSPSDAATFAISTQSPAQGAVIHVYSTQYPNASPSIIVLDRRPNRIHDFDFLQGIGLAVAIGRRVHFVPLTNEY